MKKLMSTRAAGYNWTKKELETRGLLKDGDLKLGYYARIKWNNKHSENAIRYGEQYANVAKVYNQERKKSKFNTTDLINSVELQNEFDNEFPEGSTKYMVKIVITLVPIASSTMKRLNKTSPQFIEGHPICRNPEFANCYYADFYVGFHTSKNIFDSYKGSGKGKDFGFHFYPNDVMKFDDIVFYFETPEDAYKCERRLIAALSSVIPTDFQPADFYNANGCELVDIPVDNVMSSGGYRLRRKYLGPIRISNIANGGQGRRPQMNHTGEWFIYKHKETREIQIYENEVQHPNWQEWTWEKIDRSQKVPGTRDQLTIIREAGEHGLINIKPKFLQKLQDIY